MPLDPAFVDDCPYGPEGLLLDEILEIRPDDDFVKARMPVSRSMPLTNTQRAHAVRHPSHVSGGLMVHMTGMMGFAHSYFILGLRHAEGWVGYGTRIHDARFAKLANTEDPLLLECTATRVRRLRGQLFVRYAFTFTQNGEPVYQGDQSAIWTNTNESTGSDEDR